MNDKTHWLQSPNKNYLGHWDLPNGEDFVLTIESAKWEEVKNPITNKSEAKRVVRFQEKVKPFICNQTNAQSIIKSTGIKFMDDSKGQKIQLYIGVHKDRILKEDVDCIRIRRVKVVSNDDLLTQIKVLKKEKQKIITEDHEQAICRIIDNKEFKYYNKTLNFLKNLK